jgi:hypothetical protein
LPKLPHMNGEHDHIDVLGFWQRHARPGRIGLFHLDYAPASLINWGQKRLTADGKPSPWVHCFMFIDERNGVPWIAESDLSLPIPGLRKMVDGPQVAPVTKWQRLIDRALIVDPQMTSEQFTRAKSQAARLAQSGLHYSLINLVGAWVAIQRGDLSHRSVFHRRRAMHCGHFVRVCLREAGIDPWGARVLDENTAPELIAREFPVIAEWRPR